MHIYNARIELWCQTWHQQYEVESRSANFREPLLHEILGLGYLDLLGKVSLSVATNQKSVSSSISSYYQSSEVEIKPSIILITNTQLDNNNMQQYLYILSNPSMPGLIKIGKTTNSPNQRMSELHSTGVPTPFILEFSAEVDDCHASERAAHRVLVHHRVAANREFFKISVAHALETILPVIGRYKIHIVNASHGIQAIEQELNRRKREAEQQEWLKQEEIRHREQEQQQAKTQRRQELENLLKAEHKKIEQLGARPVKKELSDIAGFFVFWVYMPLPSGWFIWMNTTQIFSSHYQIYGLICIALLFIGYLARKTQIKYEEAYEIKESQFIAIDKKIADLKADLAKL